MPCHVGAGRLRGTSSLGGYGAWTHSQPATTCQWSICATTLMDIAPKSSLHPAYGISIGLQSILYIHTQYCLPKLHTALSSECRQGRRNVYSGVLLLTRYFQPHATITTARQHWSKIFAHAGTNIAYDNQVSVSRANPSRVLIIRAFLQRISTTF